MDKACLPKPPLTLTASMNITYKEPTPPGVELLVRSKVLAIRESNQPGMGKASVEDWQGHSLEANLRHITTALAPNDAAWQQLRLYGVWVRAPGHERERTGRAMEHLAAEGFYKKSRNTRATSGVNGQQPCEEQLDECKPTKPADWKPLSRADLRAPARDKQAVAGKHHSSEPTFVTHVTRNGAAAWLVPAPSAARSAAEREQPRQSQPQQPIAGAQPGDSDVSVLNQLQEAQYRRRLAREAQASEALIGRRKVRGPRLNHGKTNGDEMLSASLNENPARLGGRKIPEQVLNRAAYAEAGGGEEDEFWKLISSCHLAIAH
ncbi:hypothetical protein QJQ45_015249, partial [Haematococcus lacustris]